MTKKFILEHDTEGMDIFREVYDTAEEANEQADRTWKHLNKAEQKCETVKVWAVDETCLNDDAIGEDGVIDWADCHSLGIETDEELFDSDEYKIYSELLHNIQFDIDHEREAFNEYKNDFEYYKSEIHKSHQEELQRALDLEEAELED